MAFTPQVLESFDSGKNPFPALNQSGGAIIEASGHTGTYAYKAHTGTTLPFLKVPISGAANNGAVGVWNYPHTNIDDSIRVSIECATGELIGVREDPTNGTLDAYVDGAKVADGTPGILGTWAGVYHNVQLYVLFDDAVGRIQGWIDGHLAVDYTGDTIPAGATGTALTAYLQIADCNIDDLAVGTGGQPGDIRVEWLVPDADTGVADWTPLVGPGNYQDVDEIPVDDAVYVHTAANGQADEYELEDFTGTDKTIIGVDMLARGKVVVASDEQLKVGVDSGGTDDTTTHNLTTTSEPLRHCMPLNPDDAAAWEDADIDALLARIESVI